MERGITRGVQMDVSRGVCRKDPEEKHVALGAGLPTRKRGA